MPHTKLAVGAFFYVFLIIVFILLTGDFDKALVEAFSVLFVSVFLISLAIESRQLIRQTRFFAHVFIGNKHRQLKTKILLSLDKTFILNSFAFVASVMVVASIFSIPYDSSAVIYQIAVILMIGLAIYPFMLCLTWVNISFSQVSVICAYGFTIFLCLRWLGKLSTDLFSSPDIYIFALGCIIARGFSQFTFWNIRFEKLLKNK